jgi:alkylation response protein AidB-like acyl-CoA dehydrogenase
MDFGFSQKEELFREEVIDFIHKEFPPELRWKFGCTFTPAVLSHEGEDWEFIKAIRRKLGAKGWLSLNWPEKYGGRNSHILQIILFEEILYYNVPAVDHIGVTFFAPTLLRFGSEEQKNKYLPGIARGETFWCELLSEPNCGSDLVSLKTQAVQDGSHYVINGQKIWTSGAHKAGMGFILARTAPDQPKHKGLTYFILDMKTPGIKINPIINLLGEHDFNEVYLDDVRVPEENIVGGKNQGWNVTKMTLDLERVSLMLYPSVRGYLDRLAEHVRQSGQSLDQFLSYNLSQLLAECEMARMIHYRAAEMVSRGEPSTYEAAIDKMFNCELAQRAAEFGMRALGQYGGLRRGSPYAPLNGWPSFYYLDTPSYTLMGGTSEIDRNVIATKGLGLPAR